MVCSAARVTLDGCESLTREMTYDEVLRFLEPAAPRPRGVRSTGWRGHGCFSDDQDPDEHVFLQGLALKDQHYS
jgi:hypothetical protein